MQKKIRPAKLQYEWNQGIKTHKLNKGKVTLIKKYIRAEGLQKGRLRNLTNRFEHFHAQLKKLQDTHLNAGTHLTQKEKTTIQNQAYTLFRDIELFMRSETIFQEGRKDTKIENRSSDRMHDVKGAYFTISLALASLERRGLVEKGFKNKCIPETVLDYTALQRENQAHHNSIVNKIGNKKKLRSGFEKRRKHFEKLKQDPLFSKLLSKTQKIEAGYGEPNINLNLLLTGAKNVNIFLRTPDYEFDRVNVKLETMNISFLLDNLGRVRFFGKVNSNKSRNNWIELRGLSKHSNINNCVIATKIDRSNTNDINEQAIFSTVVKQNEREITFDSTLHSDDLLKIQKFM